LPDANDLGIKRDAGGGSLTMLPPMDLPRDLSGTRSPELIASMVAAAITPLMPGAGPPPTKIAKVCFCGIDLRPLYQPSFSSAAICLVSSQWLKTASEENSRIK
jgi:hypothetical protein